jgi:3-oxoacyl-[acyl-carrier protein] reductase
MPGVRRLLTESHSFTPNMTNVLDEMEEGMFMKKVALVTGASGSGIGRSTALTLAREGYQLVINYHSKNEPAEALCLHINNNGGNAIPVKANIFSQDDCQRLINETIVAYKRLDVCIIGPGADWNPEPPDHLNTPASLQDAVQEISPIYSLIPRLLPEMMKTQNGRIIAIASNPNLPSPSYSYNVAKNARIAAMMGLTGPCWKHKITVNIIAPGPIDHLSTMDEAIAQVTHFPMTHSPISPQDIAELIAFLCSDKGRYITGNVIAAYF